MLLTLSLLIAIIMELVVGEPRKYHPLVTVGKLIDFIERKYNVGSHFQRKIAGSICATMLIVIVSLVVQCAYRAFPTGIDAVFAGLVLWSTVGYTSLKTHVLAITTPLQNGDIAQARFGLSGIVSRDTESLDQTAIISATCESAIENTSDAIVAPIFWFFVFGPLGAAAYRIINTLDAMWGYKNPRFTDFGWMAARADDVANYVPARITALSYLILASKRTRVLKAWKEQAHRWQSPNAGLVMATGAAMLGVQLGGSAYYEGSVKKRPNAGFGCAPTLDTLHEYAKLMPLVMGISTLFSFFLAVVLIPTIRHIG